MRCLLIVCLLAACERAGDSQNPIGSGGEIATGPTGPRVIIDASVATLPNDAAPIVADAKPVVADAAVVRADARRRADADVIAMDEAAIRRFADQLAAVPRDVRDDGVMSNRQPGADLGRDLDNVRNRENVAVGGGAGRGTRGGGDPRVGVGTGNVGTGGQKIDSSGGSAPSARVSVTSTRTVDDTSLTSDIVIRKISAAYLTGIKRCYQRHLSQNPNARGSVTVTFGVTDTGRAENTRATGFHKDIDDCIAGQLPSWRFPAPKDKNDNPTAASFELALQLVPS